MLRHVLHGTCPAEPSRTVRKTHSGTFTLFSLHFVKEGPVPESLARAYQEALDTREFAKYAKEFVITEADAADVLADAEEFVAFPADLLG